MSAIIVPLPPRKEGSMSSEHDPSVPTEETEPWRQLDVEETGPYGDDFFAALAGDIEASIDADTVTPPRRRGPPLMAFAAAAALALGWWAWSAPSVPSPVADGGVTADAELEAMARAVGRAARDTLTDDDVDSAMFASVHWLAPPDDEGAASPFSLLEELDDLDGDELSTLFLPL